AGDRRRDDGARLPRGAAGALADEGPRTSPRRGGRTRRPPHVRTAMTRTILFVCEHGAFRSRIAAAYFNAAAPKGWRALSAGRDPQAEVSARLEPLLAGTAAAEHLENGPPRGGDAVLPDHLIAIGCGAGGA